MSKNKNTSSDIRRALTVEFFIAEQKSGLREGFRRLSMFFGVLAFIYTVTTMYQVVDVIYFGSGAIGSIIYACAICFISIIVFFVIASSIKSIGWVIEGFLGCNEN